jgi:membrane protein
MTDAHIDSHGRQAEAPTQIPPRGWKDILFRLWNEVGQDRVMLIAAGVTYYLLLALVPGLTAIVSIYGLFTNPSTVADQVDTFTGIVPSGGLDIIREQLVRLSAQGSATLGLTFFVSLAIALWSSSAGIRALFDAMNVAYGENEKRSFVHITLLVLAFTFGAVLIGAIVITVVVLLPAVLSIIWLGAGKEWLIRLASYGVLLAVLGMALACIYRYGPSREQAKWRWVTPGATLSVALIVIVSVLFSWYAANFANYDATYGSLGALIGFMTWIWLSVTIVIVGAEVDAEIEHQTAKDSTTGPERPLGTRGAVMAVGVDASGHADIPKATGEVMPRRDPVSLRAIVVGLSLAVAISSLGSKHPKRRQGRLRSS